VRAGAGVNYALVLLVMAAEVPLVLLLRQTHTIKDWIFAGALALMYAVLLVVGVQLDISGHRLPIMQTIAGVLGDFLVLLTVIGFLLRHVKQRDSATHTDDKGWLTKKRRMWVFASILVLWGLGYCAMFPGMYGYDAGYQILEFADPTVNITTHFSVVYSAFLYAFVAAGHSLFGSYVIGFGLYTFVQMMFLVVVCYKVCIHSYELVASKYMVIASAVFFVAFPYLMIMSVSSSQDAIFAGLFALVVIETLKMTRDRLAFFASWKKPAFFALLLLLLFMFRNNGVYVILLAFPLFVVVLKGVRLKAVATLLAPLMLFEVYSGPILNLVGVSRGNATQEMMSIPMQQLARVYNYNPSSLSPAQRAYLLQLVSDEKLETYKIFPAISDAIKSALNTDLLKSDYVRFADLYISVGLKDPYSYTEAFLLNSLGLWFPTKQYPDPRMYHPMVEYQVLDAKMWNTRYISINRTSMLPVYDRVLSYLVDHNVLTNTPGISLFFTMGTYFFLLLLAVAIAIYRKLLSYLLPLGLILALYVTIFLAPATLFRYAFPMMLCVPLMVGVIFAERKPNPQSLVCDEAQTHIDSNETSQPDTEEANPDVVQSLPGAEAADAIVPARRAAVMAPT